MTSRSIEGSGVVAPAVDATTDPADAASDVATDLVSDEAM
jgi:hypothetical protein